MYGILYSSSLKYRVMPKDFQTPSYSSPKASKRGCLCWDKNTYSRKCCDGSLRAQGIGRTRGTN
jgi:hypothetical protein